MSEQRKGPLWDAVRLAAEGAPTQGFLAKAIQAKEDIADSVKGLWREVSFLDNLVAHVAPDAPWVRGLVGLSPPAASPVTSRRMARDRSLRTLEIAESMVADGANRVSSRAIAEALRSEGFQEPVRALAVSAGNTLARAHGWHRIKPGAYAPVE